MLERRTQVTIRANLGRRQLPTTQFSSLTGRLTMRALSDGPHYLHPAIFTVDAMRELKRLAVILHLGTVNLHDNCPSLKIEERLTQTRIKAGLSRHPIMQLKLPSFSPHESLANQTPLYPPPPPPLQRDLCLENHLISRANLLDSSGPQSQPQPWFG